MAMSVTATETTHTPLKKIKLAWVSAADGTASGATTEYYSGKIEGLTTVPDGGGTQPTDNYDITLTDGDSVDVLMGGGANRSNASTQHVLSASLGCVVASKLTLNVSNAGDSKGGTAYVWVR